MKLVFRLQFEGPAVAALAQRHTDVHFVEARTHEEAIEQIVDADAFVVAGPYFEGAIADAVNNRAPSLKWVQSSSIGVDKFEKFGLPEGVSFTTAAGLKGRTVGEHAMALLLAQVHAVPAMEAYKAEKVWARDAMRTQVASVEGGLMLLLGYGSVGQEVARKAKAFDMEVVALNRSGAGDGAADRVGTLTELNDWLSRADFLVSTLPLTADTRHLIGASELAQLKSTAVIVNVGRGETFDQAALSDALASRQIAAACLDVFEKEPLELSDPMWDHPNLILSPHVAGTGGPMETRFAELVSDNLDNLKNNRPLLNLVKIKKPA